MSHPTDTRTIRLFRAPSPPRPVSREGPRAFAVAGRMSLCKWHPEKSWRVGSNWTVSCRKAPRLPSWPVTAMRRLKLIRKRRSCSSTRLRNATAARPSRWHSFSVSSAAESERAASRRGQRTRVRADSPRLRRGGESTERRRPMPSARSSSAPPVLSPRNLTLARALGMSRWSACVGCTSHGFGTTSTTGSQRGWSNSRFSLFGTQAAEAHLQSEEPPNTVCSRRRLMRS